MLPYVVYSTARMPPGHVVLFVRPDSGEESVAAVLCTTLYFTTYLTTFTFI